MTVRDTYMILASMFLLVAIGVLGFLLGGVIVDAVDAAVGFC